MEQNTGQSLGGLGNNHVYIQTHICWRLTYDQASYVPPSFQVPQHLQREGLELGEYR